MQQREEEKNKRKTEFCVFFFLFFFYFLFSVGLEEDSYQIAGTFFPRGRADGNRKRSCTTTQPSRKSTSSILYHHYYGIFDSYFSLENLFYWIWEISLFILRLVLPIVYRRVNAHIHRNVDTFEGRVTFNRKRKWPTKWWWRTCVPFPFCIGEIKNSARAEIDLRRKSKIKNNEP